MSMSQNNSVSKLSWYRPDGQGFIPYKAIGFSFYHCINNSSGVHQAFYAKGIRGSFPEDMIARAWILTLNSLQHNI